MKDQTHVDTTETTSCLEWCAGYGGISLGLKRAIPSLRTIAFGEIEAFACANLVAKMEAGLLDPAPIWTDIKTFPCEEFRDRVDILVAGYPCQPFSAAGKRLGTEDPRHLWPYIQRSISIIRPRLCFFENVEGHISLGLSTVISDLEELGYRTTWGIFSASEVGAPHRRKRIFILAHRECEGLERLHNRHASTQQAQDVGADAWASGECSAWPSRPGEQQFWWEPPRVIVDDPTHPNRRPRVSAEEAGAGPDDIWRRRSGESGDDAMANGQELRMEGRQHDNSAGRRSRSCALQFSGSGGQGIGNECETQPPLGRDADGPADWLDDAELFTTTDNRTDELRLLGNGVVPATAARAFLTLMEELSK